MKIIGTLYAVGSTEVISEKFQKRDFVIETDEKYPQFLTIQMINDQCDELDRFQPGDNLEVDINLKGRKYQSKKDGSECYFNSIQGWRISNNSAQSKAHSSMNDVKSPVQDAVVQDENGNDLPF